MVKEIHMLFAGIISLAVSAALIGNFIPTFLGLMVAIGLLSFLWTLSKNIKHHKIVSRFSAQSITLMIIILLAIGLPYVILGDSFVSFYYLLFIYIIPLVFLDAYLVPLLYSLMEKVEVKHKKLLIRAGVISIIISILFVGGIAIVSNKMVREIEGRVNIESEGAGLKFMLSDTQVDGLLPSYFEVIMDLNVISVMFSSDNMELKELKDSYELVPKSCFSERCAVYALDANSQLVGYVTGLGIRINQFRIAEEEYVSMQLLSEGEIQKSVEDMKTQIYSKSLPKKLIDGEIRYEDLDNIYKAVDEDLTGLRPIIGPMFDTSSEFKKSNAYVFTHLNLYKSFMGIYANIIDSRIEAGYLDLYEGLESEESLESKYIRCKLLLDWLEENEKQG